MGNWNRRYVPRKKFRHYHDYQHPSVSHSYSSGSEDNKVPSWEIDYCHSVGVPWRKIVASKKYIYCYPSVLNWKNSSGEEALQNAKQRYWAMINGLPCDKSLPDPDMYIYEIDWNPYMDPELMADIDLQAYNPDDSQKFDKLETIIEEAECSQAQCDKNQSISDNPWEKSPVQAAGDLKEAAQGWGKWDHSVNLRNGNPWMQSCSKLVDPLKSNAWGSQNESRGWDQRIDTSRSSAAVDHGCGNSYNYIKPTVAVRQRGWGKREKSSWSWNVEESRNLGDFGYSYGDNYCTGANERGWGDNEDESWGRWKDNRNESSGWWESDYRSNQPNYWYSQGFRGGMSSHGGHRKREGTVQHTSKYKSSRHHDDTHGNHFQL